MKKLFLLLTFISFVYADTNKIPTIIKAGNYYEIQFNRVENVKVLKIDRAGWIEVKRFRKFRKSPVWLNLSNISSIREISEKEATTEKKSF